VTGRLLVSKTNEKPTNVFWIYCGKTYIGCESKQCGEKFAKQDAGEMHAGMPLLQDILLLTSKCLHTWQKLAKISQHLLSIFMETLVFKTT
jgi:hypothetical protein